MYSSDNRLNFAIIKVKRMIKVKFASKGLECNQHISEVSFAPNGNTIVRVVCEKKCYQEVMAFEDSVCRYLSSLLPQGQIVTTHHVTINSSMGEDMSGRYIESIDFQVFIDYVD